MLETNLRIINPGIKLCINVRRAVVEGQHLTNDLLEQACGSLRYRRGLSAVRNPGVPADLLIASNNPIQPIHLEGEDWELDITDAHETSRQLNLTNSYGKQLIPQLIEREVLVQIARRTDLWNLNSPRIFYEREPFQVKEDIAAYRRYEIAAVYIEDVGVAIAVDIGTAFFTVEPISYYFDNTLSNEERKRRYHSFLEITGRQTGQKGTLMYDNSHKRVNCYFEKAPPDITCSTTGKIRVKGTTYASLAAYYQAEYPKIGDCCEKQAICVSFRGIPRPQWVVADRVWARVMNDDLPKELSSVDKIRPADRRELIKAFWKKLEPNPLGQIAPGLKDGFWAPDPHHIEYLSPEKLHFGKEGFIAKPSKTNIFTLRNHFKDRMNNLSKFGCYSISPMINRTIYCAYPKHIGETVGSQFASDITTRIRNWTELPFVIKLVDYKTSMEAIEKLNNAEQSGTVIFILDNEPTIYYDVSLNLPNWRIKRATAHTLNEHYRYLDRGIWDKKLKDYSKERGKRRWEQFIVLNALDLLQQMDGIPWKIDHAGPYEAQVAIDVGHDRRHVAISLLIARNTDKKPNFGIYTNVQVKPDSKQEKINHILLNDQLFELIKTSLSQNFNPINSILIVRDGKIFDEETESIQLSLSRLKDNGFLTTNARIDIAELRKDSLKSIRLWEVNNNQVINPLEGTTIRINNNITVITTTGEATLTQGTAEPLTLITTEKNVNVIDIAEALFSSSQLNWSSPSVAQRLPLTLKRTDDELRVRASQEIRRIG
ncbi:MAG: hypothetical protein HPY50_04240 [Firmicutes bacterium]|nr:hypothetical protein [Bacillota bacterium]